MAAVDLDPSARLCVCGVRGCSTADLCAVAFVIPAKRRKGRTEKRKRGRRSI